VVAVVAVIAYVGRGRQVGSSGTTQQQSGMINKAATIACRTWNGQMQMDRRSVAGDARGEGAVVVRGRGQDERGVSGRAPRAGGGARSSAVV
jgi:hypothetical protein